jgi:hypothetical protein
MRITTRGRVAFLIAVAALIVAALAGSQLATAGSQEDGGGSAPAHDGGGVAGICAAAEPGEPAPKTCDDTVSGICAAPEDGDVPVSDCDDTVSTICAAPEGGATAAGECHDMVGPPGDDGKIMDPGDGAKLVVPTPGMAGVRPHAFDHAVVGDDGTTVTIFFWSGVEPCYVLDHVDVSFGAKAVTITLFEGHDPNAGDVACIEIALLKKVVVELDEPVGDREIVDGAA